jgi:hypothetical protein
MPKNPTPGQRAYAAFWHCHPNDGHWTMLDAEIKQRWEAAAQAVLALVVPRTFAEKSALNQWAAARYDALMQAGKHGHYETMFRVIQEALAQAVLAQGPQQAPRIPTLDQVQRRLCRWCGQPIAAHPQAGEPWRCRLSDGPLLPKEQAP